MGAARLGRVAAGGGVTALPVEPAVAVVCLASNAAVLFHILGLHVGLHVGSTSCLTKLSGLHLGRRTGDRRSKVAGWEGTVK